MHYLGMGSITCKKCDPHPSVLWINAPSHSVPLHSATGTRGGGDGGGTVVRSGHSHALVCPVCCPCRSAHPIGPGDKEGIPQIPSRTCRKFVQI